MVLDSKILEMPYERYGDMIFNKELTVMRISYDEKCVVVMDKYGKLWKVTYKQEGNKAVLTQCND